MLLDLAKHRRGLRLRLQPQDHRELAIEVAWAHVGVVEVGHAEARGVQVALERPQDAGLADAGVAGERRRGLHLDRGAQARDGVCVARCREELLGFELLREGGLGETEAG